MRRFVLFLALIAAGPFLRAQSVTEAEEAKAARMQWFADAKLGILIHWGI